jgi:hypothetical protein
VKALWKRFEAWFNGRVLRERVLVFLAVAVVLVYAGFQFFVGPAWRELQSQRSELANTRTEIRAARQERRALSPQALKERRRELRGEQEKLRQKLAEHKEALAEGAGQFIEPDRLMGFLERFLRLRSGDGMRVRSLQSLAREPVPGTGESAEGTILYRKGVRAVFEAGFGPTRRFLEALTYLPWAVQVTRLDYHVQEHPTARVNLEAHTFLLPLGSSGGKGEAP